MLMNHESDFQQALRAEPESDDLRQVYADWLEQQGDPRAELLRLTELLRRVDVPKREQLERRLRQLLDQEHVQPVGPFRTNSTGMKLAWIPSGTFLMGSAEDEPDRQDDEHQHQVTLTQGFWLGVTVVTQEQYQQVMGTNPSRFASGGINAERVAGQDTRGFPVERVRWEEGMEFCQRLSEQEPGWSYTLPTEAQWEYACRAGTSTPFHFGEELTTELANYARHSERPSPVGSYPPNAFGLFDMHGNVCEWCLDWYGRDYYQKSPSSDPQGPGRGSLRVIRGGSWNYSAGYCRSSYRFGRIPPNRLGLLGFRLAAVPSSERRTKPVSGAESGSRKPKRAAEPNPRG